MLFCVACLLFVEIVKKMLFCSRLWQMKEVLRWSVRSGAGLVWPSGLAILQARTLDLCCARTTRGSSTPLKCSSLVPACRYHSTYSHLFVWVTSSDQLIDSIQSESICEEFVTSVYDALFALFSLESKNYCFVYLLFFLSKLCLFYINSSIASQSTMMVRMWIKSTSHTPSPCDSLSSHPKWAVTDAERTAASLMWVRVHVLTCLSVNLHTSVTTNPELNCNSGYFRHINMILDHISLCLTALKQA